MGGKALQQLGVESRRVNTEELYTIYSDVSSKIMSELGLETDLVKFYRNKKDHGDADILVKVSKEYWSYGYSLVDFVMEHFTDRIHNNGNVISFDYNGFQVDLIPIDRERWDVARAFFAYSPLGNLMGKVAHKFGLKYGFNGLVYPFRSFSGKLSHDILISTDARRIFDFLGYDSCRHETGDFMEETDIFDYVINGKYFNAEGFFMENLNAIDRKRNKHRPDYQRFLQYIEANRDSLPKCEHFKSKDEYLPIIDAAFPECGFLETLSDIKKIDERSRVVASKFNGRMIMEKYPDLTDKWLGNAMTVFKAQYTSFEAWVYASPVEEIMLEFDKFYNTIWQDLKQEWQS